MDQDTLLTLVGFGFMAFMIVGVKIYVHTKANKAAAERKAKKQDNA